MPRRLAAIWQRSIGLARRWPLATVGLAVLLALLAQTVAIPAGQLIWAGGLFALAAVLAALGMRQRPLAPERPWPRWAAVAAWVVVLGTAVVFRTYLFASQPEGVWFDEGSTGLVTQRMLADATYRPIYLGRPESNPSINLPAMMIYWQAGAVALFGPNVLALRLVTTLVALASVAGLYWLARTWFGPLVGATAAVLLASERWHVNFSRTAMNGIMAPAVAIFTLYFFVTALRTGRVWRYALAGACLGLGVHSYTPFAITPALLFLALLGEVWRPRGIWARLRAHWRGWLVMLLLALAVAAPMLHYMAVRWDSYSERMRITSVFRPGKEPERAWVDLRGNIQAHLLMFNVAGDRNGRHNLPGAPMADSVSGALMVLGLGVALARLARPGMAVAVAWLVLGLVPGILTLEFEAPQGLRSIMATAAVPLLASLVPGWLLARAWSDQPRWQRWPAVGLGAVGLSVVVVLNFQTYFNDQLRHFAVWAAHSTAETLAAREMLMVPPEAQVYLSEYFVGHPSLRFIVGERVRGELFDPAAHLPLAEVKLTVILLSADGDRRIDQLKTYYPAAQFTEFGGPDGGPSVLTKVFITPEEIRATQGATVTYTASRQAQVAGDKPLASGRVGVLGVGLAGAPANSVATWQALLMARRHGSYLFRLVGSGEARLFLDERPVARLGEPASGLVLAQGVHSIRLEVDSGSAAVELQAPEDGRWRPVATANLFTQPVVQAGLVGTYYGNASFSGEPALRRIDPTIAFQYHRVPLARPWSVEWRAKVRADASGDYTFSLAAVGKATLLIDGVTVIADHAGNGSAVSGRATLAAGWHDLLVRFVDDQAFSRVALRWQPPGGPEAVIPMANLLPAGLVNVTSAPVAVVVPADREASTPPAQPAALTVLTTREQVGAVFEPRGVTVDEAGAVYVADAVGRRVMKLGPGGAVEWSLGPRLPDGEFVEPVALALHGPDVLVLDARASTLYRVSREGAYLGVVGPRGGPFYNPRGLTVDATGIVWLADTGGGRVVALAADGTVARALGQKGGGQGQIQEPTDIAVAADGTVYVVDVGNSKVVVLDATGSARREWVVPRSTSVQGPHLALAPDGGVFVTDPPAGTVRHYAADGTLRAVWLLEPATAPGGVEPVGVAVEAGGALLVAEARRGRVVRLVPAR